MGEIMEISGLGQPDVTYTSFLHARLTVNGKPQKGVLEFYNEDGEKIQSKVTDANGFALVTFPFPKTTRVYVATPGNFEKKTVPGMTTDEPTPVPRRSSRRPSANPRRPNLVAE